MNKSALKSFATEARLELLEKIQLQARKLGITPDAIQHASLESSDAIFIDGKPLSDVERKQRNKLITRVNEIGYDRVMEEAAYTWFNRFIALRYMEVNDYLPTKVRVLSSVNPDSTEPDMFKEALNLDLPIDIELVYNLKIENKTDELFKYLIKIHCNDLNRYMPFMFETIEGYTEVLFPEGLLNTDTFIRKMTDVVAIPEEDWTKVEIVGWLYQYYISEEKDEVFANLKKNIKITKDKLPAATQLFTPNWIVRYMVENSLGKIWMESYPDSALKEQWKYFLDEAKQEESVKKQLEQIRYKNVNPEEITFLDPCCGSGHILVYAFDVFYDMYLEKGYIENEIPQLILSKNLFGLDVDDRAVQLASFAVMMKAREKSRRIFRKKIDLNIVSLQESNWLTENIIEMVSKNNEEVKKILIELQKTFFDAKEYGSLLYIEPLNYYLLEERLNQSKLEELNLFEYVEKELVEDRLPHLIKQANIIHKQFNVVCTNPPYMGRSGMNSKLRNYLNNYYPDSKSDLFATFLERGYEFLKDYGFNSMVTMHSWMFLSSYENLRKNILEKNRIKSVVHLGMEAFEGVVGKVVQTVAFVMQKDHVPEYISNCIRLVDFYDRRRYEKENQFFNLENRFYPNQMNYSKIPGSPIAYWVSEKALNLFSTTEKLGAYAEPRQGLATGNDELFLKFWHEVDRNKFGIGYPDKESFWKDSKKYAPFNKGGAFRRWYGNNEYVIKFDEENFNKLSVSGNKLPSRSFYFKEGITWTALTNSDFSGRYCNNGYVFAGKGPMCFPSENIDVYYLAGVLNSKITNFFMSIFSMTLDYNQGTLRNIPFITKIKELEVKNLVNENIQISRNDWDSFEISWDFKKHPFLNELSNNKICEAFKKWDKESKSRIEQLKMNEEELNQIFIEAYGLQDELSPEVELKNVTIRKADLERDIKSFISYALGCMLSRYSLDEESIIFAGGDFDPSSYKTFLPDKDNILPILSGVYFENDIVTKFVDFVRITFSEETLEENLDFVADAIGRKKTETAREAIRRYFLNDFFKDHVQTYKKRPIYWLFTSGKEKAFNCLIYMHRYDRTTLSRIRTDYVHEVQNRMDAERTDLLNIINGESTVKEIAAAKKELRSLEKKIDELIKYDELLHHMADQQIEIDLDDGVKHNYELFKGLVAKI